VLALAFPLAGADLLTFAKELIITSWVGHMGPDQLSAFVLGQAMYNITGAAP
jgi:MATE family multidrug resistance protein